ncbi:hypothetical protein GBAR_LOCUS22138, partial [Geodia barretti]
VWRPSGSGCYSLVGFNRPVGSDGGDGFLSPPDDNDDPLHRCVVLSVTEDQQIEVQSGDVVGYYVDHFRNGDDNDDGGIQWLENHNNVVVHYKDDLPREAIKSHYALGGPNPTECGFPISGDSNSYSLTDSFSAAPIISLSFVTTSPMPTTSVSPSMPDDIVPTPTPTPSVVDLPPPHMTTPSTPLGGDGDSPLPTEPSPPSSSTSATAMTGASP